jgi:hypothetical protein
MEECSLLVSSFECLAINGVLFMKVTNSIPLLTCCILSRELVVSKATSGSFPELKMVSEVGSLSHTKMRIYHQKFRTTMRLVQLLKFR